MTSSLCISYNRGCWLPVEPSPVATCFMLEGRRDSYGRPQSLKGYYVMATLFLLLWLLLWGDGPIKFVGKEWKTSTYLIDIDLFIYQPSAT